MPQYVVASALCNSDYIEPIFGAAKQEYQTACFATNGAIN
jgi:hypothetical protein